jgi:hypothetical protein
MKSMIKRFLIALVITWTGPALAMPITDTVIVGTREWAQPDLFANWVNWNDINEICPSSSGSLCGSEQIGRSDMSGWTWASVEDVNALFNHFLIADGFSGEDLLSGPDTYFTFGPITPVEAFFDAGFRPTPYTPPFTRQTLGWTSDRITNSYGRIAAARDSLEPFGGHSYSTSIQGGTSLYIEGAWFYRTVDVPLPSTLVLILIALTLLPRLVRSSASQTGSGLTP